MAEGYPHPYTASRTETGPVPIRASPSTFTIAWHRLTPAPPSPSASDTHDGRGMREPTNAARAIGIAASKGKHRKSRSTAIRGLRMTPPTSAAVTVHRQNTGSAPDRSAIPYPMDIPANIVGKKCPPRHPMLTHIAVTRILTNPVTSSNAAPMPVQSESSSTACDSPENIVKGRTTPQTPRTAPATTGLNRGLSPNLPDTRDSSASDTQNSHPARAPIRISGTSHTSSFVPTASHS